MRKSGRGVDTKKLPRECSRNCAASVHRLALPSLVLLGATVVGTLAQGEQPHHALFLQRLLARPRRVLPVGCGLRRSPAALQVKPAFNGLRMMLRRDACKRFGLVGPRDAMPANRGDSAKGAVTGGIGGAVLGGLLLGPFGAVFGASLGSDWGREKDRDKAALAELGLDEEMVAIAQQISSELASAMEDEKRVDDIRADFAARAQQLTLEVQSMENKAMEALRGDDEEAARSFLAAKLQAQSEADACQTELSKVQQRYTTLQRSVTQLEQRALEVARLLERAQAATGSERTNLAAEASSMGMSRPRDPLLDKFDALERGER